jgi:hypothetical protein
MPFGQLELRTQCTPYIHYVSLCIYFKGLKRHAFDYSYSLRYLAWETPFLENLSKQTEGEPRKIMAIK